MPRILTPDARQEIDPDQIARVEIARHASAATAEVRFFLHGSEVPHTFEFDSMADAISFYERVWSQRTIGDGDTAISHSA